MDRNGDLRRCASLFKNYGNLFEKSIKYDLNPRPCPITKCGCPHERIRNLIFTKGNFSSILKEDFIEKSLKLKRVINNTKLLKKLKEKAIIYFAQNNG